MDDKIKKTKTDVKLEEWKKLLTDFNCSSMSVTQWCKTNNIGKSTFYKYQRLVRMSMLRSTDEPQQSFVPVTAVQAIVTPVTITRGDIKIELNGNSDMNTVMNMIRVLLC